ncbi:MAG TPA: hypothetical protein P5137_11825, partial [Candidatus Brocadiia bacterium]|nr:hypothetical protein [Candidatus Brocadiia bacterium]
PCSKIIFWVDNELLIPIQIEQTKSDGEIIDTYTLDEIKLNPWWWTSPFQPPPSSVNIIRHDLAEEKN